MGWDCVNLRQMSASSDQQTWDNWALFPQISPSILSNGECLGKGQFGAVHIPTISQKNSLGVFDY